MTSPTPSAWIRLLLVHRELVERMERRLRREHDLSLREYEILAALAAAPDRRMRRVDLAGHVAVTQSGVTRLLEALEADGLVDKARVEEDRRVWFAVLTDRGRESIGAAARTLEGEIDEHFTARLTSRDAAALDRILAKLPGGADDAGWRAELAGSGAAPARALRRSR